MSLIPQMLFLSDKDAIAALKQSMSTVKWFCEDQKNYTKLQTYLPHLNQHIAKLNPKEIAGWAALIIQFADKLAEGAFEDFKQAFSKGFSGKKIEPLLLRELYAPAVKEIDEAKSYGLLRTCCRVFTPESLNEVERAVALQWVQLAETHDATLAQGELGRMGRAFHTKFTYRPQELKKSITFICTDGRVTQLPLVMVMASAIFARILRPEQVVIPVRAHVAALRMLEELYFSKGVPSKGFILGEQEALQLSDMARLLGEEGVAMFCLKILGELKGEQKKNYGYYGEALAQALEADRLYGTGNISDAKTLYTKACNTRPTDHLSLRALGKIAINQNDYKAAIEYLEKAAALATYAEEVYLLLAQSYLARARSFDKLSSPYFETMLQNYRKIRAGRSAFEIEDDLQKLLHFAANDTDFSGEKAFLEQVETVLKRARKNTLAKEELQEFVKSFKLTLQKLRVKYMSLAHNALNKIPEWLGKDKEEVFLAALLCYEQGDVDKAIAIFESLRNLHIDSRLELTDEEQVFLYRTLAVHYRAQGRVQDADGALSLAVHHLSKDRDRLKEFILFDDTRALEYGPEYLEAYPQDRTCRYAYAKALFEDGDREEANTQFCMCDPNDARVNFYRGKLDNSIDEYKKALVGAHEDGLSEEQRLELAQRVRGQCEPSEMPLFISLLLSTSVEKSEDCVRVCSMLLEAVHEVEDPSLKRKAIDKAHLLDPKQVPNRAKMLSDNKLEPEMPTVDELTAQFNALKIEETSLRRRVSDSDTALQNARRRQLELEEEKRKLEVVKKKERDEESKDKTIVEIRAKLAAFERARVEADADQKRLQDEKIAFENEERAKAEKSKKESEEKISALQKQLEKAEAEAKSAKELPAAQPEKRRRQTDAEENQKKIQEEMRAFAQKKKEEADAGKKESEEKISALQKQLEKAEAEAKSAKERALEEERLKHELEEAKKKNAEVAHLASEKAELEKKFDSMKLELDEAVKEKATQKGLPDYIKKCTLALQNVQKQRTETARHIRVELEPQKLKILGLTDQLAKITSFKAVCERIKLDEEILALVKTREAAVLQERSCYEEIVKLIKNAKNPLFPPAMKREALQKAREELKKSTLNSSSPDDHAKLTRKLEKSAKQIEVMEKLLDKAVKERSADVMTTILSIHEKEVDAMLLLGKLYLDTGEYEKAYNMIMEAVKLRPYDPTIYLFLAEIQARREKYDEAEKSYSRALERSQGNVDAQIDAHNGIVQVKLLRDDKKAAKARLDIVRRSNLDLFLALLLKYDGLVSCCDIPAVPNIRALLEKKITEKKATLTTYCALAKVCRDTKDEQSAANYTGIILACEDTQAFADSWKPLSDLALVSDMRTAKFVMEKLLLVFERTNSTNVADSIVRICYNVIERFHEMPQLLEYIEFIKKYLMDASRLPADVIHKIREVGIAAVGEVVSGDSGKAKEAFSFLEYLSTQEGGFLCLKESSKIAESLIRYLRETASNLPTNEAPLGLTYQKIINQINKMKS